jgi:checkpoint serine/threonine-protein kinase
MDETLVIYYTIEILRIVEALHNAKIIHADIKPDNFLILMNEDTAEWETWRPGPGGRWDSKGLRVIDFGRSLDLSLYPEGTVFTSDCHADGFQCIEMKTNQPWTYQTDIFGICAVAHTMLHADYLEVVQEPTTARWKPKEPFKRYWKRELWEQFFDACLNIPDCNSMPSLSYFREQFEQVLMSDELRRSSIRPKLAKQNIMMTFDS